MENASAARYDDVLRKIKEGLDKLVPPSTKKIILELRRQPLWMEIGKTLYHIPLARSVNEDDLIEEMADYIAKNDIGYVELHRALKSLEGIGYLKVERSEENYILAKEFAEAIELTDTFDREVIEPFVEVLKQNPKYHRIKDLKQSVASEIYDAME